MSRQVLFELQYDLSWRQRLVPHLVLWLPLLHAVIAALFFIPLLVVSVSLWFFPVALIMLWLVKGFFIGLLQVIIHPKRQMNIVVEENGLGFRVDDEPRWWIFLDGVQNIRKISDTWTLLHHNGTVINVPTSVISDEQVELLQSAVKRAKARAHKEDQAD